MNEYWINNKISGIKLVFLFTQLFDSIFLFLENGKWNLNCYTQVLVVSGRGIFTHMSKGRSLLCFWENCVRSVRRLAKDLFWCVVVVSVG